ncbi:MAG: hypothetical protein LBU53_02715 [Zoogloeaceae bacterium]|jgi:hypothetical protein|nr:hypothetical protein [Zoogloeaceae bacterium]
MSAVDRFIAGEDRLSAALKAIPFYDASDTLAASVQATARQTERAAWHVANALTFEPSAALADAVSREAKRMQAAQTTRREALLNTLAKTGVAEALGVPVTAATESWLRQQAARREASTPARKAQYRWWTLPRLAFGFSCGLALFIGFATYRAGITPAPQIDEAEMPSEIAGIAQEASPAEEAPLQIAAAAPDAKVRNGVFAAKKATQEASPAADKVADLSHPTAKPQKNQQRDHAEYPMPAAAAEPMTLAEAMPAPVAAQPPVEAESAALPPPASIAASRLPSPPVAAASAARSVARTYTYLARAAEWQQLANSWTTARQQEMSRASSAAFADKAGRADAAVAGGADIATPIVWYLEADNPETEDIRALAALLRAALPPGVTLTVRAHAEVPSGYARLAR